MLHAVGAATTQAPLPFSAAGCQLLVDPPQLLLHIGGGSRPRWRCRKTRRWSVLFSQVLVAELSSGLAITDLSSSNGLRLTIDAL